MLNVALPQGRLGEKVYSMFASAGFECPEALGDSRKLIFTNEEKGVSYFWVKPSDVSVYVERGAADIGVVGKDIIDEYKPDVYEILDLNMGKCRMCVAARKGYRDNPGRTIRVATKFSNIALSYYSSIGRDIDIIHLNGKGTLPGGACGNGGGFQEHHKLHRDRAILSHSKAGPYPVSSPGEEV